MWSQTNIHKWNIQDVLDWLRHHKFDHYTDLFENHAIDGSVLLTLKEKDLRSPPLSISKLGDIKKLYSHIIQLQADFGYSTQSQQPWIDIRSTEFRLLKKQLKSELQHSLNRKKVDSNDQSPGRDTWSDLGGNDLFVDSASESDLHDDLSVDEVYTDDHNGHPERGPGFPLLRLPKGEYQNFKPEAWKAFLAMLYFFAVTWLTAIIMVIVHDRVPDMQTYPPLPDIFLDNVPLIPGAFTMCELCGLILFIMTALLLIFHKHRFILIRRMFSLFGSVFLLRCITMLITSLSVPGRHLDCKARHAGDWISKLKQAYQIWQGGGMSIQGVRTCGDYMFSGHTVVLTLLNFFITEYTPHSFYFVHTVSWVLNLFGVFFILAGHEHYSIDVFIAFYISTRLFLYYHTLANNRALYQGDRKRTRIWFPLFYFFESGVNGIVPNQFEIPFKGFLAQLQRSKSNFDSFDKLNLISLASKKDNSSETLSVKSSKSVNSKKSQNTPNSETIAKLRKKKKK